MRPTMIQHLSIRVPWKDNGYTGLVCDKPCYNTACMKLKNIAETKDDSFEDEIAGKPIKGHEAEIPCLSECGCFMSSETYTKIVNHPYKKNNSKLHSHFLETELKFPPYSFVARPFAWTMLERTESNKKITIEQLADEKGIKYDADSEPSLGFHTNWVQEALNQREIFKTFYKNVVPNKSLAIAYAKQVPFIEDAKRVVMGIGFVTSITEPPEYNHTDAGDLRSVLWETMIGHSIRDDRKNGFLLPYKEMMEYANSHPDFDINSIAVLVDDEYFSEFSYATEQVSYDAVINVLLKTIKALRIIKDCISGNWNECIKWCKERLKEVWLERGSYPGLGVMLSAIGFEHGNLLAEEIRDKIGDDISDYENKVYQLLEIPHENLSTERRKDASETKIATFKGLSEERKNLFWLLARIFLTKGQAKALFNEEDRKKKRIDCSDKDILENPYFLYEKTRMCSQDIQLSVNKIDMAVFPPNILAYKNPLSKPSLVEDTDDKRRIRALAVNVLEQQTNNGHTVYPKDKLVYEINNLPIEPECQITCDVIDCIKSFLDEELKCIECDDGTDAFQLTRLYKIDSYIREVVGERLSEDRFTVPENWGNLVNETFEKNTTKDEKEEFAREEKVAILKELAASPISVLIGGAGTGKTTLLSILCKSEKIKNGGVLLLAPTGKARVRISKTMAEQNISHSAMTVAQFLIKNDRFDWNTMQYRMSNKVAQNVPATVIIDECSMMTEEMFGATLSALHNASRIIFVGDPNQLPPIGAGRPFVDLVRKLKVNLPVFPNPQVTKGFGELTVTRRQSDDENETREDILLSQCFAENKVKLDDDIFIKLQENKLGKHIVFKQWTTPEELQKQVFETIREETGMKNVDDIEGFDISLGGTINNGWMNFGTSPSKLDSWQILSAYKSNSTIGTASVNRYIHDQYRSTKCTTFSNCKKRSTKHILGTDGIVFGDKVINIRNVKKDGYPNDDKCLNFVANGEVGIVERLWEKPKAKSNTHQIRFSSQPNYSYNWYSLVGEENNDIELAYALTVHKAQGSEFDTVILILSEPSRMISRELLYTALTRQKNKIVILYNDEAYKLKKYLTAEFSDIAQRFTCLFQKPKIVEYNKKFYEDKLIHKTARGELVRSKSEVIIANLLDSANLDYTYEQELKLKDGQIRSPDFTIRKSGKVFYWEHLGMLQNSDYAKKWKVKKQQYAENGIVEGKNLITSRDELDGSIDSQEINQFIKEYIIGD